MKKTSLLRICSGLLFAFGACFPCQAAATNAPSRFDFESFKIISDRNIFDATRTGRGSGSRRDRSSDTTVRTESFALLGTLSYEKGVFAFFDGTSSEYRKALKPSDTIAGFKIVDISPNRVTLEGKGTNIVMAVSTRMRKEEGDWRLSAGAAEPSRSVTDTNSPPSTAGLSDLEKRLMEQREKEVNK